MAAFEAKAEDAMFVNKFVADACINAVTSEHLNITVMRTPYSRMTLSIIYPAEYPEKPLIVDLSSATLPKPLLKKKTEECNAKVAEHIQQMSKGEHDKSFGAGQVRLVYCHLQDFIENNLFVPCWKELKQVMTMFESANSANKITIDEKTGTITARLKCQGYFQTLKLLVPELYPEMGIKIEFSSGNFPADMSALYLAHANEIVRRCEAGFSPEKAASALSDLNESMRTAEISAGSSVRKAVEGGSKKDVKTRALDAEGIKALKRDVNVLKEISELRSATKADTKPFQYEKHATAERKVARQKLRRLARAEQEMDHEEEEMLKQLEQQEMLELVNSKCSEVAQPSLHPVCKYVLDEYVDRLPKEPCQKCQEAVLAARNESDGSLVDTSTESTSSSSAKEVKEAKAKKSSRKPMRTFCGHWLHHQCLDTWLTTPPFIRDCPVCTRRIWHPAWPADHKQLEKAWQKAEAAKREQSEISDLMGF